ncbi:uncharacterized protein LOC110191135 [Drosophila serrata]|uniref:uncharacterized protein LOC110191135 n=1 Tax=Drosophila serrata TaxID=7274 RepID=UPI000A1D2ACF|nr:uncharacterized protein LOC110191135 [Drosophila serrata]
MEHIRITRKKFTTMISLIGVTRKITLNWMKSSNDVSSTGKMYKRAKDTFEKKRIYNLKALFKKVVRIISLSNPWIEYENDEQTVSLNVKKNISMRVRSKHKSGFLTAAEKAIIRTPHSSRSIPDRRKLCSLFATLICFAKLTPKLRARLVPVIRLLPLNAGRIIISKSDVPITLFFILVGEVHMIKGKDSNGNELVEGIFGPGDIIGDVELLEGCRRTHTFKTSTYCELLVLFDYDYAEILGPYMTKAWDEKKRALKALNYFDFLDDEQIVEACRLGSLKQYSPLDTMYCDDEGSLTNVHFVLSGECLILQCLNMTVTMKKGKRVFRLMPAEEDETSKMLRQGVRSDYSSLIKRKDESTSQAEMNRLVASSSGESLNKEHNSTTRLMRKMNLLDIEKLCGLRKEISPASSHHSGRNANRKYRMSMYSDKSHNFHGEEELSEDYWGNWIDNDEDDYEDNDRDDYKYNDKDDVKYKDKDDDEDDNFKYEITAPFPTSQLRLNQSKSEVSLNLTSSSHSSKDGEIMPFLESRFIDVGSITFGGIFGLGEQMKHRVIMARTTVQCLILPRFFLLENKQNPGNMWERRLFYLDCMIPSREALFKQFLKTRRWKKFKNDFIRQTVKLSPNHGTHIDDIPIICRIVESAEEDTNFSK